MYFFDALGIPKPGRTLESLRLLQHCRLVVTDSGGMKKETYFHAKYCVTLRHTIEWSEPAEIGASILVGADDDSITHEAYARLCRQVAYSAGLCGEGNAAARI